VEPVPPCRVPDQDFDGKARVKRRFIGAVLEVRFKGILSREINMEDRLEG
jgi:hypothetical protein